jgi:hypothetical protein
MVTGKKQVVTGKKQQGAKIVAPSGCGKSKMDEHVAAAERLARANGGVLPNVSEIAHVAVAERLAKANGGILPNVSEIMKAGRLLRTPTGSGKSKMDEHVAAAEKLAKANGGVLPSFLKKAGSDAIAKSLDNDPGKFSIPSNLKKIYSVFLAQFSCSCAEFEDKGRWKVTSPRIAVEKAFKGDFVIAKDEHHSKVVTKTGTKELSLFYGGETLEDTPETMVVIEGEVNSEEAIEIFEEDMARFHASRAAKKAWKTMKDREAKMSPKQLKALHQKRSDAAKKAWDTIRSAKK